MSLISLILTIALVGFVCWLILQIPMPAPFHKIILGIVCFIVVIYVLQQAGFLGDLPRLRLK